MKIKCAIVDDDINDLTNVDKLIKGLAHESDTSFDIDTYNSPKELNLTQSFDLYILDIDMPEMSGFYLANKIYELNANSVIIFCSNHDDLVFDSFKLNAFYFVRKSFLKDDMILALKKFIQHFFSLNSEYVLKTNSKMIKISLKDIIYFEITGNNLYICTDKAEYHERKSMKQLKNDLFADYFIQINQNFLINAYYIEEIDDNKVVMKNKVSFEIPRRSLKNVKNDYLKFIAR